MSMHGAWKVALDFLGGMCMEPDRLIRLRWLRDQLVRQIEADDPDDSQLAPLAGQLVRVLEQIELVERAQPRGSAVDELKGRREDRRASPARRGGAAGRGRNVGQ